VNGIIIITITVIREMLKPVRYARRREYDKKRKDSMRQLPRNDKGG
jgi:hypothetical protein